MSRKHSAKDRSKKQKGAAPRSNRRAKTAPRWISWTRHLTPVKLGLGLGVVAIGVALIWGSLRPDGGTTLLSTVGSAAAKPVVVGLPPAPPGTKAPINSADPLTSKSISPSSPTTVYKGYVIAFCCEKSSGHNGAWASMSESEKDAFVRRCLK